jgi:hypothetical protein
LNEERSFMTLVVVACVACSGGERTVVEPPPPTTAVLTLTIQPDLDDADIAQQLGWTTGIPSAEVNITPADTSVGTRSFTTNTSGVANLGELKAGKYIVGVRRLLTSPELSKLSGAPGVVGFVSMDTIDNSSGTSSVTLNVPSSRRRSLVMNESSWRVGYDGGIPYQDGGYFELYNNSDTTIYLDGITIGFAFNLFRDGTAVTCQQSESMRNDPAGIWSLYHQTFPGTGRDYPIRAGELVTVAQDAIDHRPFYAGMPDLRAANFEFVGLADVDNPTVPNMVDGSYDSLDPHGMPPMASGYSVFLALPVDLNQLPRQGDPRAGNSRRWWRYPASSILDVFSTTFAQSDFVLCAEIINRNFDRHVGFFEGEDDRTDFLLSPSRRVIGNTADGHRILQDSRNSAVDFVKGPVTPLRF